jgi:hypothetical protein
LEENIEFFELTQKAQRNIEQKLQAMVVDSKIDEELKEIKYLTQQQERKVEAIIKFLKFQVDE